MQSVFDLPVDSSQLPSFNDGMAQIKYVQNSPTRDVVGNNFANGSIHIRFEVAGTEWWIPSRSYIRMRASILQGDDARQPLRTDDLAPNMGLMANLFQSAEFRIGGRVVSRVSNFMAQVDALKNRLNKSKSWLDSTGKLNFWQPHQVYRKNEICSDGSLEEKSIPKATGVTHLALGIPDAATLGYAVATGLITVGGGFPDLLTSGVLSVGDTITATTAGNHALNISYTVNRIISATTAAVVKSGAAANVAAEAMTAFDPLFATRSMDGLVQESSQRNLFELIWQPPLGVFDLPHALPAGKYELVLNPQTQTVFEERAIESFNDDKNHPADFRFKVVDLYFYTSVVQSQRVEDVTYMLSLDDIRCQQESVQATTGLQQKNFDVSQSTNALTVAYQDIASGSGNTLFSASKFKIRPVAAAGGTAGDLLLNRLFINYNNMNKPQPDANPNYIAPANYMSQRWADSGLYSGSYWDSGGMESENDWRSRGPFYHFAWPKDGDSTSTRVTVNYVFTPEIPANQGNILLFSHHRKIVVIQVVGGRVLSVLEQDA